jgi:hypothetical protein
MAPHVSLLVAADALVVGRVAITGLVDAETVPAGTAIASERVSAKVGASESEGNGKNDDCVTKHDRFFSTRDTSVNAIAL